MTTASKAESNTGTENSHYNLVSILYHALEGASVYEGYIEDAEQAGDQELAEFFRNAQQESYRCSERAKDLLRNRLQ
jgi:hypothetical protein